MRPNVAAFLSALALAGEANAFNVHRRSLEARARHVDWVTVHKTVTVYAGESGSLPTPNANNVLSEDAVPTEPPAVFHEISKEEKPQEQSQELPQELSQESAQESPKQNLEQPTQSSDKGGSKRGVAYNDAKLVNPFFVENSKISWVYDWDSLDNGLSVDTEFVPMLWGNLPEHTDRWPENVEQSLSKGAKYILSFNEPDIPAQAYMSPDAAVQAHTELVSKYSDRARIGSPGTSSSNLPGEGNSWLKNFMDACAKNSDCKVDFCNTHWYGPVTTTVDDTVKALEEHLKGARDACGGKDIWLTEFAPATFEGETLILPPEEQIVEFVEKAVAMMDGLPWVQRYAYFMARTGWLLSSETSLSSYGQKYISV